MSIEQTDISPMDLLGKRLREAFPAITGGSVSARNDFFIVEIAENTDNAPFTKALHGFLKDYISKYGDPDEQYQFTIKKGGQLVNILMFNDPGYGYHVELLVNGNLQKLFVVDVLGVSGDFSVYDSDFEFLGVMNMKPLAEPLEGGYGDEHPRPNFRDAGLWEASGELVETYLNQIVGQISMQLHAAYREGMVDVNQESDLVYYASVFNTSVDGLKEAVVQVGPTVGALEDYFRVKGGLRV